MILAINGQRVHVETYGETGDPVLLLHGALADIMQNWRMVLAPLAVKHRLIAVDLRGHGLSDNPSGIFTLDALQTDALAVLDALDIPKAHVLGCSLGGYTALALRLKAPERVASLALAGVKLGFDAAAAAARAEFFYPEKILKAHPLWESMLATAHGRYEGPEHWKTLTGWVRGLVATLHEYPALSWEVLASEREQRGLFYAVGDRDDLVPIEEVTKVRHARPDAEILVLPRAGHLFREYNAQVFSAAYLDFLRRHRI